MPVTLTFEFVHREEALISSSPRSADADRRIGDFDAGGVDDEQRAVADIDCLRLDDQIIALDMS